MTEADQDWKDMQTAERIVDYLFINGQGSEAERLVRTSASGGDLGGWSKRAATERIFRTLKARRPALSGDSRQNGEKP